MNYDVIARIAVFTFFCWFYFQVCWGWIPMQNTRRTYDKKGAWWSAVAVTHLILAAVLWSVYLLRGCYA